MVYQVLLLEDDPVLGRGLSVHLASEGYVVEWVSSLHSAQRSLFQKDPHLLILDLSLPDGDGLSFLRDLKTSKKELKVIVLTAQQEEEVAVMAFRSGACDYVRKPFSSKELFARIANALRQPFKEEIENLKFAGLLVSLSQRTVEFNGTFIDFNRRELDILIYLIKNAERVVTRDNLLLHLKNAEDIFDRTIDSYIYRIRHRLRASGVNNLLISSEYGLGYRLRKANFKNEQNETSF